MLISRVNLKPGNFYNVEISAEFETEYSESYHERNRIKIPKGRIIKLLWNGFHFSIPSSKFVQSIDVEFNHIKKIDYISVGSYFSTR